MSLATTLMAVGIPAEQANRLGYEDRVPLDGNGTTQGSATELLATQTNVAMGTSAGDTAFKLPAEAEYFLPYFLLNTTADAALIFPPVGDTIDTLAVNAPITINLDKSRIFMRIEEGRWVSVLTGQDQTTGIVAEVVAGAGINVDSTNPAEPIVSNAGVITIVAGANVTVDSTDPQNPIVASTASGTGTVETVAVASANGLAGSSNGDAANPILTLRTTVTGILSGNGTAISAASTTGSGAVVLATSPTLVTPALGTPSALVGTNITGTAAGFTAGTVTTNANLTGPITSVGNATSVASQTGTGSTFVMNTSPTLVTPVLGAASGTSRTLISCGM